MAGLGEARQGQAGQAGLVQEWQVGVLWGKVRCVKIWLARFAGFRNGCEWSGEFGLGLFRLARHVRDRKVELSIGSAGVLWMG